MKNDELLSIIYEQPSLIVFPYKVIQIDMSYQTSKTKSIALKDSHHHLPSISKKLNLHPDHQHQLTTADRKDSTLRSKVDRALKNYHVEEKYQRKHALIERERKESKEIRDMMYQHKSTPKLGLGSLERKKILRAPYQKYIKNERLSIQLKLPKPEHLNHSFDSDQQSIQNAIFKEEVRQKVQPIVFVLRENAEYGKLTTSAHDQKIYGTDFEATGEKLEVQQNNLSLPVVPSLPNRHPSIHLQPKSQKFIKEKFVGQEAVNKFYDRYKNIERVRQIQSFKLESNPITTILTILQTYNIPPKRMQVIKLKGEEAILDLKNCALGAGVSIKAISEIIEKVKIFQEIDLSYNQITPDLTDIIIPNLLHMRRIDLSYNKIGRKGVELLNTLFWNEDVDVDCELQQLNLESNNITDSSLNSFFTQLSKMNYLTVLNLSKNCLGNITGNRLKQFLLNDSYLSELYLHWCELGIKATKLIFDGLAKNNSLRVLDLSWNQIGLQSVSSLCKMVKRNVILLHLDISYCEIDEEDTKRIAKALKHNHTIYGIHYQGNMGYIDFKGNLHHIVKGNEETPVSIRAGLIQRINSINMISDYYKHQQHMTLKRNICWICEGWQEIHFQIKKEPGQKACFIHLDFEYYTGVMMTDKGTYYELTRMCPPKQITYFFTKVSAQKKFQHVFDSQPSRQFKVVKNDIEYMPDFLIEKKQFKLVELQKINKMDQPIYATEIFNDEYSTTIHCQPRSDDMVAEHLFIKKPPKVKKPRKKIEVKKPILAKEIKIKEIPDDFESVFNKKAGDGQQYDEFIRKCVDFDIKHSKVTKILKNQDELEDVKTVLLKNYDLFQKIYYYLANNNPNSNGVFSISETRFEKFIEEQGYETKRVTKAKIRLKLVSCVSYTSQDTQILSFYRPQFFQFLLRLAIEKWCKPKKDGDDDEERGSYTVSQAFEKMLRTLRKYEEHADSSKWRDQNLTSYDVSIVIKSYSFLLEHIYNKYAGFFQKNMNTKSKKKMFLEQMKTMLLDSEIRKTRETFKDLEITYRTVKKLQIEDGISDTGIDYVQFLQCFCRFSEHLFLIPIGTESSHLWEKQLIPNDEIPLFLKIEKLLQIIYSRNHDLHSKKYDAIFAQGLFPEQVVVLMEYYKEKYDHHDHFHKIYHLSHLSHHAKMNSLEEKKEKITLNFLINLLAIKARKIQEQNRQKILEMEAERQRLEKQAKLEEQQQEKEEDSDKNEI